MNFFHWLKFLFKKPRTELELWQLVYQEYLQTTQIYLCIVVRDLYRDKRISRKERDILQKRLDESLGGYGILSQVPTFRWKVEQLFNEGWNYTPHRRELRKWWLQLQINSLKYQ